MALRAAIPLSGRAGAGLDPCAALLLTVDVAAGASRQVVCFLGQAEDPGSVVTEINAARNLDLEHAYAEAKGSWEQMLGRCR